MTKPNPEPSPEPTVPVDAEPVPETSTTRLRLTGPSWHTVMIFPDFREGTLAVDREGTEVPADAAPALIETAAKHGVTLTECEQ